MKAIFQLGFLFALLLVDTSTAKGDTIILSSAAGSSISEANGALEYMGASALAYGSNNASTCALPCNAALSAPSTLTGLNGTLSASSTTYAIAAGTWSSAISGTSWVSNTLSAGTSCSGSSCDPNDFYYYQTAFTAAGGANRYEGSLSVMADDTAEVILNAGMPDQLILVPFAIIGSDGHCASGNSNTGADPMPNCSSAITVAFNSVSLLSGTNTLTIIDAQTGLHGAGVDFDANFTAATPEPTSLMLLGTGFLGLALVLFRKIKLVNMAQTLQPSQ